MDLGWVGMTQVGSEEVRTSRWTPRQRSSGTTGGTSGNTSMSLKLSNSFIKSKYESDMVKGSFSFNLRRTMKLTTQLSIGHGDGTLYKNNFDFHSYSSGNRFRDEGYLFFNQFSS